MTITRICRIVAAAVIVGLFLTHPALAQVTINSTTFSSNVAASDGVVNLTSTTCTSCTFGSGTLIWADGETMTVSGSYVSGSTNIPVTRTNQRANHNTAAVVFLGPPNRFQRVDPPAGACIKTTLLAYPWLNLTNGYEWLCDNGLNQVSAVNWRALVPWTLTGASR